MKVAPEDDERLMDDAVARLVVIVRDVTEQRRAQEGLRRVVESMPDGVYVTDVSGRITYVNAGAERILGLERGRIAGRTYKDSLWDAAAHDGRPAPAERLPAARALHAGEVVHDHPMVVTHAKTQARIRLRVSAAPLREESGRIVGCVVSFNELGS